MRQGAFRLRCWPSYSNLSQAPVRIAWLLQLSLTKAGSCGIWPGWERASWVGCGKVQTPQRSRATVLGTGRHGANTLERHPPWSVLSEIPRVLLSHYHQGERILHLTTHLKVVVFKSHRDFLEILQCLDLIFGVRLRSMQFEKAPKVIQWLQSKDHRSRGSHTGHHEHIRVWHTTCDK